MRRLGLVVCIFCLAIAVGACSDDDGPKPDKGTTKGDLAVDSKVDSIVKKEAGAETSPDVGLDLTPDAPADVGTIKGTVKLGTNVTCGTTAADDCKGNIIIGVFKDNQATPAALKIQPHPSQDLSGNKTFAFEIKDVPVGTVFLFAQLHEDNTLMLPGPGDIVTPKPLTATGAVTKGATTTIDITLPFRTPTPAPDGGAADGGSGG